MEKRRGDGGARALAAAVAPLLLAGLLSLGWAWQLVGCFVEADGGAGLLGLLSLGWAWQLEWLCTDCKLRASLRHGERRTAVAS
eukprot:COSAG02_NODE_98_length_37150_cov_39.614207_5_plen_84_part_00